MYTDESLNIDEIIARATENTNTTAVFGAYTDSCDTYALFEHLVERTEDELVNICEGIAGEISPAEVAAELADAVPAIA